MTVKEFLEKYNHAPYGFEKVAELLSTVIDDEEVAGIAEAFLDIRENLELILDKIGFEFG